MTKLHTSLAILLSFNFILSGCAAFEPQPEPTFDGPVSRTFAAPYDEVWRATQKSLQDYPMRVNNIEQGILETDFIKGKDMFSPPHKPIKSDGLRYQIITRLVRGLVRGQESTRVDVEKSVAVEKDFFSGERKLASDGYEEKTILYRIQRELQIDRALRKAFEKTQVAPRDF